MASSPGNAVKAQWVGPAGHQLYDGTVLDPGTICDGIGYDEAKDNPYWKIVQKGDAASDASDNRFDPDQAAAAAEAAIGPVIPAVDTPKGSDS